MCGQSWSGCAASFLGMWVVMMAAMMLPSLVPMLARYREAVGAAGETRLQRPALQSRALGWLTALVGAGYFLVWTVLGIAVFAVGAAWASLVMQWPALARAAPGLGAGVVLMAGALQFTAWKVRHLGCCRQAPSRSLAGGRGHGAATRRAPRPALHRRLRRPDGNLLVIGVMELRVMAVVTIAITIERFAPPVQRAARTIGAVVIGAGVVLMARAGGL